MKRPVIIGIIVFITLFIGAAFAFAIFQPIKVLPRIRLSPGFAMTDQSGQRLTNEMLRGSIVVFNYSYTGCTGPCSQGMQTMREIQDALAGYDTGGIPVKLVTIALNPVIDTPAAMLRYAQEHQAKLDSWHIITMQDTTLLKTIVGGGFEVYYKANDNGLIELDPTFTLVDGWGIIRGEYRFNGLTSNSERIMTHIKVLVEEVHKSVGAARLAYEAAHLFMCYAP